MLHASDKRSLWNVAIPIYIYLSRRRAKHMGASKSLTTVVRAVQAGALKGAKGRRGGGGRRREGSRGSSRAAGDRGGGRRGLVWGPAGGVVQQGASEMNYIIMSLTRYIVGREGWEI